MLGNKWNGDNLSKGRQVDILRIEYSKRAAKYIESLVHCFVNVLSLIKKSPCILPVKCLCRNIVLFYKP